MLTRLLAITLSLLVAAPAFTAAQAPDCGRIAEQFDRETKAFTAEAERQNLDFVKQLALDRITGDLKDRLSAATKDTIPGMAGEYLSEQWSAAQSAREKLTRAREYFAEWLKCVTAPRGSCNAAALNKLYQDEFKAYMDSLLEDAGLAVAQSRVERARSLLHAYLDRTLNISAGTMNAMAQCVTPMIQQAKPALTSAPAPATPVEPQKSGGPSMGKFALILGSALAAGVAVPMLVAPAETYTSTPTGNTSSPPPSSSGGGFNGTFLATVQRSCQPGSGASEPCTQAPAGGSCSAVSFTVTVSNGRVADCGPWLNGGTVTSGGSYTGFYAGSCGSNQGVPITGSFSSGTLSGSSSCRGNTYNTTITLSRR